MPSDHPQDGLSGTLDQILQDMSHSLETLQEAFQNESTALAALGDQEIRFQTRIQDLQESFAAAEFEDDIEASHRRVQEVADLKQDQARILSELQSRRAEIRRLKIEIEQMEQRLERTRIQLSAIKPRGSSSFR